MTASRRRHPSSCALGVALWAMPASSLAHTSERPVPATIWTTWQFEVLIAVPLLLVTWLYLRGTAELWRRAGTGRGVRRWQVCAFLSGAFSVALATLSPLDAMGGALFSAHMVQHLMLILVAPLLFAASRPALPLLWALPGSWRVNLVRWWNSRRAISRVWHTVNHWVMIWLLFAGAIWIWHVPALYDAALEISFVHDIEHISFALAAFLFWSCVLDAGRPGGTGYGIAILMTFTSAMHSGALGALLTFARAPLYGSHEAYTEAWSLSPLEDQQLAGVIMWVPMGMWFAGTALVSFALWLRAAERSARNAEMRAESRGSAHMRRVDRQNPPSAYLPLREGIEP